MSYLRYLCLFAYIGVQHILCCIFDLGFFILCTLCYQFLWIDLFFISTSVFSIVYLIHSKKYVIVHNFIQDDLVASFHTITSSKISSITV
jgi:hypothetical protein